MKGSLILTIDGLSPEVLEDKEMAEEFPALSGAYQDNPCFWTNIPLDNIKTKDDALSLAYYLLGTGNDNAVEIIRGKGEYEDILPFLGATDSAAHFLYDKGKKQAQIVGVDKAAYLAYFFKGGREEIFAGEDVYIIPESESEEETGAEEVLGTSQGVFDKLNGILKKEDIYDLIVVNLASLEKIPHSEKEVYEKCLKKVDKMLDKIIKIASKQKKRIIITSLFTLDLSNLRIPIIIIDPDKKDYSINKLSDITSLLG